MRLSRERWWDKKLGGLFVKRPLVTRMPSLLGSFPGRVIRLRPYCSSRGQQQPKSRVTVLGRAPAQAAVLLTVDPGKGRSYTAAMRRAMTTANSCEMEITGKQGGERWTLLGGSGSGRRREGNGGISAGIGGKIHLKGGESKDAGHSPAP